MAKNDKTAPQGDQKKPETDTDQKKSDTEAAESDGKKRPFVVASPLRHNGKKYVVGSKVSLTTDEATPLLAAKTIEAN